MSRATMVLTILVLVTLILVTPGLMGRPSELSSIPILIIGLAKDQTEIVVDVEGAVQAYFYDRIVLQVDSLPAGFSAGREENETYTLYLRVPVNESVAYRIHTYLEDQGGNYFEYNVTLTTQREDDNRTVLTVVLDDEDRDPVIQVTSPSDFRWSVPRRGSR